MRILYFSDVHLEVRERQAPSSWTGVLPLGFGPDLSAFVGRVDLLVLAGDIGRLRSTRNVSPLATGLVASLARPGGNLTGVSILFSALVPKLLELISELVPQTRAIAVLVNPNSPEAEPTIRGAQEAAHAMRVKLHILKAAAESEIDAAFTSLIQMRAGALIIGPDPFFGDQSEQLVALAARYAIPTIYSRREFAAAGQAPENPGNLRGLGS